MKHLAGLVGLFRVVFDSVTDGYSRSRAWLVITIMALIVLAPALLVALLVLLLVQFA